ncbi:MAG: DUF2235 domain-containing protein [Mycobacterium sp.]|uniref:DUF2235 domain-containing protein n=1 Tax=Mycobacterium sp. TaxID=1785 RepID=UPI003CC5C397
MSKRLVVCCDGTWNSPDQRSGGELTPTNVTKIALAVAPKDDSGREQRIFYHLGVGTTKWQRISGGVFGFGLSRAVRDTYRFLVREFEPGDELYFFGFSRGAFTARSTAGLVRNCGILRREHADLIDEAFALYRDRSSATHPRGIQATLFRRSYSHEPRIRFIGVWDTVGALGIPVTGWPVANLINRRWQFHDTNLSTFVDAAFQALAIDEQRGPFRPTLWTDVPKAQRVEQVWFTGVHCDIGGGYLQHELSDITLLWMANRAHKCGLAFNSNAFPASPVTCAGPSSDDNVPAYTGVDPDPLAPPHESRKGFYRLIPPYVRQLGVTDEIHEYAASTAVAQHEERTAYAPPGLTTYLNSSHQIMDIDCGRDT